MKRLIIILTAFLIVYHGAFAQMKANKPPVKEPPKAKTVQNRAQLSLKAVKLTPTSYRFETEHGKIEMKLQPGKVSANEIKSTIAATNNEAMCLTKEEVRGKKTENTIQVTDASRATKILPGVVISGEELLGKGGDFRYFNMSNRKSFGLRTTSNLAKSVTTVVTPKNGESFENAIADATHALKNPDNFRATPSWNDTKDIYTSTVTDKTKLEMGASAFFMGVSASDNLSFSSERYRYMYVLTFVQDCLTISADQISSPGDLFTDNTDFRSDLYYIQQVNYGRRLYLLLESEYDLVKYENQFSGSLNWGGVKAAYSQKNAGSKLKTMTNLKVITEGGVGLPIIDPTNIKQVEKAITDYFNTPFSKFDILPLSYQLTNLRGESISLVSEAFLNGQNCLDKNKIRVKIKELKCINADDKNDEKSEQVYGAVPIFLYNSKKQIVGVDGKTRTPGGNHPVIDAVPTYSISYGKKDAPLIIIQGINPPNRGAFDEKSPALSDKYVDLTISDLDMVLEIKPWLNESDDFSDDEFKRQNNFKMSLRQMLLEGKNYQTFEFTDDASVVHLTVSVEPI